MNAVMKNFIGKLTSDDVKTFIVVVTVCMILFIITITICFLAVGKGINAELIGSFSVGDGVATGGGFLGLAIVCYLILRVALRKGGLQ